jgi:DNA-3-methyladenine glycosylase II
MAATTQQQADPRSSRRPTAQTQLEVRGPYDLEEVALMGFGHRDEQSFDSVMRLAFCVDGDYERQVGVEVRQDGQRLDLTILGTPGSGELDETATATIARQVARVLSADQDGDAFARVCAGDPVLARLHAIAPGFRPASFYSPYEAALWSILSARRPRAQGIALRSRLGREFGATFDLTGVPTVAVPTPSALLQVEALPGLPADRIPRLRAVAEAARDGLLSAARLAALEPEQALAELQQLPGVGPFYSTLILVRACGVTDVLPQTEAKARELVRQLYDWPRPLSDSEYGKLAEQWRPFRTWAAVLVRAMSGRLEPA